jgi:hypothetical protein
MTAADRVIVVNCGSRDRGGCGRGRRVTSEFSRPCAWRVGVDSAPDPADRGRADLRQFDGDARLRAERRPGVRASELAAWSRYRGERGPWPGARSGLRCGGCRWLVGSHELLTVIIRGAQVQADPPNGTTSVPWEDPLHEQAVRVFADELAVAPLRFARSVLGCMSSSCGHSGYAHICSHSPVVRRVLPESF